MDRAGHRTEELGRSGATLLLDSDHKVSQLIFTTVKPDVLQSNQMFYKEQAFGRDESHTLFSSTDIQASLGCTVCYAQKVTTSEWIIRVEMTN